MICKDAGGYTEYDKGVKWQIEGKNCGYIEMLQRMSYTRHLFLEAVKCAD
jgi:hypothetical protein